MTSSTQETAQNSLVVPLLQLLVYDLGLQDANLLLVRLGNIRQLVLTIIIIIIIIIIINTILLLLMITWYWLMTLSSSPSFTSLGSTQSIAATLGSDT